MMKVKIDDQAGKELQTFIDTGKITSDDMEIILTWVNEIQNGNFESRILKSSYWNDHALDGDWKGYRSSSFGFRGRIIYREEKGKLIVVVVKITPDHNYKR